MKKSLLPYLVVALSLLSLPVFSQAQNDTTSLGLPGDNLDLYAVLDLFQKSKTIEDFEKALNDQKTGINNLDLNLDGKVDFIKVVTKQKDKDFTFILQVDVTEKEVQDAAVILVSKDKNGKVAIQIVGDKDLYGKNYVIEPKPAAPAVTANPAYTGPEPVTVNVSAPATTVVVVESAPIVQYVYSPVYVPYYPPYHYGYYPPYFAAFTVMAVGIYRHNNYYYHGAYHGGYGNTVVVHNTNIYNNYNNSRNSSNTVNHNNANGSYNGNRPSNTGSKGASASTHPSTSNNASKGASASTHPSTSNNASKGASASTHPSTSNNASKGASASTNPSTSNNASKGASASTHPSTSNNASKGASGATHPSSSNYSSPSRSSSTGSGGYSGGGGRSYSGGGRGGGGGRRR